MNNARVTTDRKTGSEITGGWDREDESGWDLESWGSGVTSGRSMCQGSGAGATGGSEEQTGRERQTDTQEAWALIKLRSNAH